MRLISRLLQLLDRGDDNIVIDALYIDFYSDTNGIAR